MTTPDQSSPAPSNTPRGTGATSSGSGAASTGAGAKSSGIAAVKRVRTRHLAEAKRRGEKFTMLTSYDMLTAALFDEAGIDTLLVGDSAANTVLGHTSSLPVTVDEMLSLARAVATAAQRALVVADLPFGSYEASPEQAFATGVRFLKEAQVAAVKLEGGRSMADRIERLTVGGIPVCGHIGFTPQSEHALGGYRVQGRGDTAAQVLDDAHAVQEAGAFAVVLEMVPGDVAAQVSAELTIPTIGIGAGAETDGQVLVWQDAFGLNQGRLPRFVKQYADLRTALLDGVRDYRDDVRGGAFPGPEHTF